MTIGIAHRQLTNPDNVGASNATSPSSILNNLPITIWVRYEGGANVAQWINQPIGSTPGSDVDIPPTSNDYPMWGMSVQAIANSQAGCASAVAATTLGIFQRFQARIRVAALSTASRFWIGMFGQNNLGGSNKLQIITDAPAFQYIAFRSSSGVDGTWKAIVAQPAGTQAIIDTGVVSTNTSNSHTFGIVLTSAGTAQFFIDFALKATISIGGLSLSTLMYHVCLADNKGTTATPEIGFVYSEVLGA